MPKKRKSRKSFPLRVKEDPALWRFSSLHNALCASPDVIASLIHAGEEHLRAVPPSAGDPRSVLTDAA